MTALIQIEDLHYRPDATDQAAPEILRGIDLSIEAGSLVAIIGENGSGKTTLLKHVNGLLVPTKGRVVIDGLDTRQNENLPRLRTIVGMVYQNPADQIVASTVAEDIAFGLENINLPSAEIQKRVEEQLRTVGMFEAAERPPHLLSGGQIQKVALAGVLARQPRVILFDEPTSMLDSLARQTFLQTVRKLRQNGMTIVYITHHMEETISADQIVAMHFGRIILSGTPTEVFAQREKLREEGLEIPGVTRIADEFHALGWKIPVPVLETQILKNALPFYYGKNSATQPLKKTYGIESSRSLIEFQNVHYTYLSGSPLAQQALNGVDLTISEASVHGLAGANGSGKSTLLQHINGILRPDLGHVRVGNFLLDDPRTALRDVVQRAGLVFQNPETQFFETFVGDEIAYGPKQFAMQDIKERVRHAMEMVGLGFDAFKDRRLETLSGGERRKVALASTLVLDQDILLFDEPTAGMDPRARAELMALFRALQKKRKTLIIASHRLEEIAEIADELSIMQSGKVTHTGSCSQVITNAVALSNASLSPPLAVDIARTLIAQQWPIDIEKSYTPGLLMSSIKDCLHE